jgi:hypothetical protein
MSPEPGIFDLATRIDEQLGQLNQLLEQQIEANRSIAEKVSGRDTVVNVQDNDPVGLKPPSELIDEQNGGSGDLTSSLAVRDGWKYNSVSQDHSGVNGGNTKDILNVNGRPGILLSLMLEVKGDSDANETEFIVDAGGYTMERTIKEQYDNGLTARASGPFPYVPRYDTNSDVYVIALESDNGIHWKNNLQVSANIVNSVGTVDVVVEGHVVEIEDEELFRGE